MKKKRSDGIRLTYGIGHPRTSNAPADSTRTRFGPRQLTAENRHIRGRRANAQRLLEELGFESSEKILDVVVTKAEAGDKDCCFFLLNKLFPPTRSRYLYIKEIKDLESLENIHAAQQIVMQKVFEAELSPDQGEYIMRMLDLRRQLLVDVDWESKINDMAAQLEDFKSKMSL